MVAWPTHRHRRQALDHAGGAQQRYRGQQEPPLPSGATTIPEGPKPASRGQRLPRGLDHERLWEEGYVFPSVPLFLAQ